MKMMNSLSNDDRRHLHRQFISNPLHSYIIFEHFNKIVDSVIEAATKEKLHNELDQEA